MALKVPSIALEVPCTKGPRAGEIPANPRCREAMVHECGRLEGRELVCEHCLEVLRFVP